jgi:hypothetical protein
MCGAHPGPTQFSLAQDGRELAFATGVLATAQGMVLYERPIAATASSRMRSSRSNNSAGE